MLKLTELDALISGLRLELRRVERAIVVFEQLAAKKKKRVRNKSTRTGPVQLKVHAASPPPADAS